MWIERPIFYQTNRFESIRDSNRIESIRIANRNALIHTDWLICCYYRPNIALDLLSTGEKSLVYFQRWPHFLREVNTFIDYFRCQVSSGCSIRKIIKIGLFFSLSYLENTNCTLRDTLSWFHPKHLSAASKLFHFLCVLFLKFWTYFSLSFIAELHKSAIKKRYVISAAQGFSGRDGTGRGSRWRHPVMNPAGQRGPLNVVLPLCSWGINCAPPPHTVSPGVHVGPVSAFLRASNVDLSLLTRSSHLHKQFSIRHW